MNKVLMVMVALGVINLAIAVYGAIYCPTQTWVDISDWILVAVWGGVAVLAMLDPKKEGTDISDGS